MFSNRVNLALVAALACYFCAVNRNSMGTNPEVACAAVVAVVTYFATEYFGIKENLAYTKCKSVDDCPQCTINGIPIPFMGGCNANGYCIPCPS